MTLLILLGSVSGAVWGALGYWLVSDTSMRNVAWIGLMASPAIGVAISVLVARFEADSFLGQCGISLVTLYLAVALFGAALGSGGLPNSALSAPASMMVGAFESVIAITVYGAVVVLWPLSFANNLLIRARPRP